MNKFNEVQEEVKYITTQEASKMLGLSVGTTQKLMDDGNFEGYKTTGGHRKITYDSVIRFRIRKSRGSIQSQYGYLQAGLASPLWIPLALSDELMDLASFYNLQIISGPTDLVGHASEASGYLIDGRVSWLDWKLLAVKKETEGASIIYNCTAVPQEYHNILSEKFRLLDSNLSKEWLSGYMYGFLNANQDMSGACHLGSMN